MGRNNILYLTFEHPTFAGGGLATYMDQVAKMHAVAESDAKSTILHVDEKMPEGTQSSSHHHGIEVISFNPKNENIFKDMGHWAAVSYALSNKILELISSGRKFDWIESCDGFALAYFSIHRKLAKESVFKDLKFCITAHTPVSLIDQWSGEPNYRLPTYWVGQMERFCLKAADLVISPSQFLIEELRQWGLNRDDIHIVRNPYDLNTLPPAATPDGSNTKTNHQVDYLVASRVHHFKGIPELLSGFDRYWRQGGKSRLLVAGADTRSSLFDSSLTKILVEKYSTWVEQGLLKFSGRLERNELSNLRIAAKALFHPSLKENFPYTVIEHMAIGGVVAASNSGGQAELIEDGLSGFLFNPSEPDQIASVIRKLDELNTTSDLRQRIGLAAVEAVRNLCHPSAIYAQKQALLSRPTVWPQNYPFVRGRSRCVARGESEVPGLLSVVIPHYNLPEFLPETVDSVLASQGINYEIIIVDDGSSSPTAVNVAQAQLSKSPHIRLIQKPNSGVADTRNVGVAAAKGEFIALLDADDLVSPKYYSAALNVLQQYTNVGYVGCWNENFNENGTIEIWPTFNPEPPTQFIFNSTNCQGLIVRRQAFLSYGQHDKSLQMFLDDWESTIGMLAHDVRGVMLAHPLFRYRIRSGSIYRSKQGLWQTNYEKILHKHASLIQEYAIDALLFLNQNGPNTHYHNPTFPSSLNVSSRKKNRPPARQALSDLAKALKNLRRSILGI